MKQDRRSEHAEQAEPTGESRALVGPPNRTLAALARGSGAPGEAAALARAVASGVPLSNRGVARMLQRWDRAPYGYDDVLDQDDYGPAPAQTQTPAPAPAPAADAPAAAQSAFRTAILAEAMKLVPAKEPDAKFYAAVDKDTLEKARTEAAAKGAKHTTCIDFQGVVTSRASLQARGKLIRVTGITADVVYPKAWNAASAGMPATSRPSPGDVYVLHKSANTAKFSHTGIIRSIEQPAGGGVEAWHTIDGGQGSQPHEEHKENTRYYHPDTNAITGEANQGDYDAILWGWVDVDKL